MRAIYKIGDIQNLFDREIFEVERAEGAYEADEGFEIHFEGEQNARGEQTIEHEILRIIPVLENGKPRIRFEVRQPYGEDRLIKPGE